MFLFIEFQDNQIFLLFHAMANKSTPQKTVTVRLVLRKSLRRRSKKAKHRKKTSKSSHIARSLITPSLLKQNARFNHVSVVRNPTLSTKTIGKNKNKKKQNISQISTLNQQQISNNESQQSNIQSIKYSQRRNSKHNIQILDTTKQLPHEKVNNYNDHHVTVSEESSRPIINTNSTVDKMVLPTSHISQSNRTPHLISTSLQQSRKNVHHSRL